MGIKKTLASLVIVGAMALTLGNGGCSAQDKKYLSDEFTKGVTLMRDFSVGNLGLSRAIIDGTQKIISYDNGDTRVYAEPTKKR
jgi:hypothetical protein